MTVFMAMTGRMYNPGKSGNMSACGASIKVRSGVRSI